MRWFKWWFFERIGKVLAEFDRYHFRGEVKMVKGDVDEIDFVEIKENRHEGG